MTTFQSPFHLFEPQPETSELPEAFTYPFHYTPHRLTLRAAEEVEQYIQMRTDWKEETDRGKMFGVLIVKTSDQQTGYLAAFSGNLAGSNHHEYFVPPVYDLLNPEGFFRKEESNITDINRRIKAMETDSDYQQSKQEFLEHKKYAEERLKKEKMHLKAAKQERDQLRQSGISPEEQQQLIHESQYQKAEYKRLEHRLKAESDEKRRQVEMYEQQIDQLKEERKNRSAKLQMKLFEQFRMLDAHGNEKDLCEIFKETPQRVPPAGTGECALPKLLQYAYKHNMKPLAMGEFWWGQSPKDEIRLQGHFYPSCKNKCAPILQHMLQGLEVEQNPLTIDRCKGTPLTILYEDEWLLAVDKPEGMLTVPGKDGLDSVYHRMKELYPEATGPLIVHRLDMATSGILIIAKTKEVHEKLQHLFEAREVDKTYTALLEGKLEDEEGTIKLPLCPNINDRPRQMVDYEQGKPAVTLYKVLERNEGFTLVALRPVTGRTHQLRVHAAHPAGLNHPIVGDKLYGKPSNRLYLHASRLSFVHPMTGKRIKLESQVPFGNLPKE